MKNFKKLITKGIHSKKLTKKKMAIPRAGVGASICATMGTTAGNTGIPNYSFSNN